MKKEVLIKKGGNPEPVEGEGIPEIPTKPTGE